MPCLGLGLRFVHANIVIKCHKEQISRGNLGYDCVILLESGVTSCRGCMLGYRVDT